MSWTHMVGKISNNNDEFADEPSLRTHMRGLVFREMKLFYFLLSFFSYFFIITLALLYFGKMWTEYPKLAFIVSAMSEPYMGALAIYTILKEYRKKTFQLGSLHRGEVFVAIWTLMLVAALALTAFSDSYTIGEPLRILISNSTAVILIYIGGLIHRP